MTQHMQELCDIHFKIVRLAKLLTKYRETDFSPPPVNSINLFSLSVCQLHGLEEAHTWEGREHQ